jgi:hypothetical protein
VDFQYGEEAIHYLKSRDQKLGAAIDQIGAIPGLTDPAPRRKKS